MVASLVCGVIYGVLQLWVIRKRTLEPYSMINVLPFMIMAFVLNFTTRSEILPLDRSWLAFLQTLQVVTLTLFVGFAVLWSCQRVIQREVDALPRD